jgi:hypothetical protein
MHALLIELDAGLVDGSIEENGLLEYLDERVRPVADEIKRILRRSGTNTSRSTVIEISKTPPITAYVPIRGGRSRPWQEISADDVRRWNKSTVLAYAKARGLSVQTYQAYEGARQFIYIGSGVGDSYRAALIDLLESEDRRRATERTGRGAGLHDPSLPSEPRRAQ